MLKTVAQRIAAVMAKKNFTQQELATALGLKQGSVSVWMQGGNLRAKTVALFESRLGISPAWLLHGVGNMFVDGVLVEEPLVVYTAADVWSKQAIAERLARVVADYKVRFNMTQREISDEWQVNESHFNSVLHGVKPMVTSILLGAMRYGNVNLNYIMGGVGGFYMGLEQSSSAKIDELTRLVQEQGRKLDELQGCQDGAAKKEGRQNAA